MPPNRAHVAAFILPLAFAFGPLAACSGPDAEPNVVSSPDANPEQTDATDKPSALADGGRTGTDGAGPAVVDASNGADAPIEPDPNALPPYPYCSCIAQVFGEGEQFTTVNGLPVRAYTYGPNDILYATGDSDQSFKPSHWIVAGGYPDRCAARFAAADPALGWTPPPQQPPTKLYVDAELVCYNADQGYIHARIGSEGRPYLCRTYSENYVPADCGFVPQSWAHGVCGISEQDGAQFDTYDPNLYRVCSP